MPLYDFKNTQTGEEFEKFMSIASKEEYLKENPHIISVIGSNGQAIQDPVRAGIRKHDNGFKEVLQKVHSRAPGSVLNKNHNL